MSAPTPVRAIALAIAVMAIALGSSCRSGSRAVPGAGNSTAPTRGATPATGPRAQAAADGGGGQGAAFSGRANWPMPNPVAGALPNPQSYQVLDGGMVQDNVTGLMWQRTADTKGLYWPAAQTACATLSLGGHADWRLPSLIELVSIVDFSRANPAIDNVVFPNPVGGTVWTANPVVGSPGEAWYVSFNTGFTYLGHQAFLAIDVRCVRGGRPDPAAGRYAFPTPQTVSDLGTGLLWQRSADATTRSWDDAGRFCGSLALSGTGWRLPSVKELQTLLDLSRSTPALDPTAFPSAPTEQYWTSSPLAESTTEAWSISFRVGTAAPVGRESLNWVRCVR